MKNRKQSNRKQIITPHGVSSCFYIDGEPVPVCPPVRPDYRRARAQSAAGWLESATFTPFEPLGFLSATFQVPEPPEQVPNPPEDPRGSLIYLFCGAEDAQLTTILQPVLQWGNNGLFGDDQSWWIACWHCSPTGQTRISKWYPVQPGEIVRGTIEMQTPHETTCDWGIEMKVVDDSTRRTFLSVPGLDRLMLYVAGAALEAYSLPSGDPLQPTDENLVFLPSSGSTEFDDVIVRDLNGNPIRTGWRPVFPDTPRFDVDVSEDFSEITLVY